HFIANVAIRGDSRGNHPDSVAAQELGDVADTANIGVAVFFGEAEALAEIRANDVPVENLDVQPALAQDRRKPPRNSRFSGPGQAGEPDGKTASHSYLHP